MEKRAQKELYYKYSNIKPCDKAKFKLLFERSGFEKEFLNLPLSVKILIFRSKEDKVKKILKLIREKLNKGWKLKSFLHFFLKQLSAKEDVRDFIQFRAFEFIKATKDSMHPLHGSVDTSIVVGALEKLRKIGYEVTEEIITKALFLMKNIKYRIQTLAAILSGMCYRFNGKYKLKRWQGMLFYLINNYKPDDPLYKNYFYSRYSS